MAPSTPIFPVLKVGHIDDVQELEKAKQSKIPERFVRDIAERPTLITPPADIPVIDLSKLVKGDKAEFDIEISKLSASCEEWGFFQVINHGIEVEVSHIEKLAMEFFMLPLEEKQKYSMTPGQVQGYGQAYVYSDEQKLDWCNMFNLAIEPHYFRNLSLWPKNPPTFSETIEIYCREIKKVSKTLVSFIAMSLGLNKDVFEDMFGVDTIQGMRMNYYPACPRPDLVMGLSPHSDGSAITVLQQGKGNPAGLQIFKNNSWVPVQPIPNALIINIGDTIEALTNGRYKSVEHRAVTHKEKDRLSIVSFYAPSYDTELGPMPEFIDESNPAKYRRYNHGEYSNHYIANKGLGRKILDFAKIHP